MNSFYKVIQKIIKGCDSFLNKKYTYLMSLHAAPMIDDKDFHFHAEFYSPLRSENKSKVLAGFESMVEVFIIDVLSVELVKILR